MTIALLAMAGCSDDAPETAIDFPDVTAAPDAVEGPDSVESPDTPDEDSEAGRDIADPEVSEPGEVTTPPEDNPLCQQYCAKLTDCNHPGGTNPDACNAECVANLSKDPDGWSNSYRCAVLTACPNLQGCINQPIPSNAACAGVCSKAEGCHMFPSAFLGQSTGWCTSICTLQLLAEPVGYGAFYNCVDQNLQTKCGEASVLACNSSADLEICSSVCSGGKNPEGQSCAQVPAPFQTEEVCLTECSSWTTDQRWTAGFCVDNFDCAPGAEACFPPPTEPLPGVPETCVAAWKVCGGAPGWELPKDPDFCGWVLSGVGTANPALDFTGAAECLNGLDSCPEDRRIVFGCLSPLHPPCVDMCAAIVACQNDYTQAECELICSSGASDNPTGIDMVNVCLDAADDCLEVGDCIGGSLVPE